ncbi:hypothetical protein KC19_3G130900 [Ceratodon purpureus]|uniref:Serine protease n=1 Tax=Ceratodon purpureus TaxID=3225 RepID=A0A8T0IKH3_CERPU|nr:hypothetical protein KC19_3G130900 [Ceratodon purpureus]
MILNHPVASEALHQFACYRSNVSIKFWGEISSASSSHQMNFRDEEVRLVIKKGKRQISGVNEEFLDSNLKVPGNNQHRPPISSFQKRPVDGLNKLPVVIDSFGAINILPTDKFGAVQEWDNRQSSSFGSTYSRRFENAEESTGSFNIAIDNKKLLEDARGKYHCIESGSLSVNESGCGKKLDHSTSAATSNISSRVYDGPYSSSTTYTCTLDERTSNDNDDESGGGPPIKRHCDSSRYIAQEKRTDTRHVHFQSPEPIPAEGNASHASTVDELLPSGGMRQIFDTRTMPAPTVSHGLSYNYIEETRLQSPELPSASGNPPRPQHVRRRPAQSLDLNELPKPSAGEDSRSSGYSLGFSSEDGSVREIRSNYKFASIGRQAYLRQRMEARQRIQDATPVSPHLPETHGAERCRHVVSPEDLVWLNVRNYCGMVLDRETGAVLGTAVLFIPTDSKNRKSAWVTSVNTVEGRWEVVIKDSKGEIQVAKLMLTSTAFGLAFFSVRTWQKTFALAFLSMVSGSASLPHRLSVDAERGDQVYVFGYEEPWESEIGKIADIRVRPGKITDAGNMEIVEVDFTKGRLGGSIATPAGFSGGLVARADGLWAGVITGQMLAGHPSRIDFCSAYNVYSFLDEL